MTEPMDTNDQAERIRRLQERRAASGRSRVARTAGDPAQAAGASTGATAPRRAPTPGKRRRRHPAAATRILLAGLSVASFFTIGGSVMLAQNNAATVAQTTPTVAGSAGTNATVPSSTAAGTSATPATANATSSTHRAPAPHTTTRAS